MTATILWNLIAILTPALGIVVAFRWADKLGGGALLAYTVIRFVILLITFTCLGAGPGDLDGWYMHAKWMVQGGCFPGKDFLTPYSLGFNALLCFSVLLWDSPLSIIVMYTVVEFCAMLLLFGVLNEIVGAIPSRRVLILYASSPVCLMSYRSTQEEPLILLAVAIVLWCVLHARWWGILLATFVSIFITKMLTPIFLFPILAAKRWRGVWILIGSICLYLILAHVVGANPFDLRFGRELGVGDRVADIIMDAKTYGNIWAFVPDVPAKVAQLVSLSALAAISFLCVGGWRFRVFSDKLDLRLNCMFLGGVFLTFVLTYPRTFFMYTLPALPFIYMFCVDGSLRDFSLLIAVTLWQGLLVYTPKESSFLEAHLILYGIVYFLLFFTLLCCLGGKYLKLVQRMCHLNSFTEICLWFCGRK